ncbi:MAG TPA: histidine kinase dimerization/phospho-acceptor domain-containing protein, partial [Rhodanobacteraceae bacterium]|nr:histidine kinase dimerization/phospho-acceptor domain-containing protein [Rhodanobacteraceae bacterium]
MNAPLAPGLAERLATGLAVLDADLRVAWLNGALADLLEVGVRGLRGQPLAMLLDDGVLAFAAQRALAGDDVLRLRGVRLTTLQGRELLADLELQGQDDGTLLLEAHALASSPPLTPPLWATLRGFAHEVKNPLAGLRGAAQLLQRRVADAQLKQLAGMVIDEADRLAALADRLLHHGGRPQLGEVNAHELLQRVAALLAGEPQAPRVYQDYDPSLPAFPGDAGRVQQVLVNLARNAVEAGARAITLRTRVEHAVRLGERMVRAAIRIDVADDGA